MTPKKRPGVLPEGHMSYLARFPHGSKLVALSEATRDELGDGYWLEVGWFGRL